MTIQRQYQPFYSFLNDVPLHQKQAKPKSNLSKSQIIKNAIQAMDALAITQFDINHTPANYKTQEYVHKNVRNARGYMVDKHYTIAKIINFDERVYRNLTNITINLLPEFPDHLRMQVFTNENTPFQSPNIFADATLMQRGKKHEFSFSRDCCSGAPFDGLEKAFARLFKSSPFTHSLTKLIQKNFGGYELMDITITHPQKSSQFVIDWGHDASDGLNLYLFLPWCLHNPAHPPPTLEILNPEIKQAFFAQDSYNILHQLETRDYRCRARMKVPMEIFKMPLYQEHEKAGAEFTSYDIKNQLFMLPGVRSWSYINQKSNSPTIYHNSENECAWRLNSLSPVTVFKIELKSICDWRIH